MSKIIAFARYLPVTPALPVTSEVEDGGKVSNIYTHALEKLKECPSEHHCEFSDDIEQKIVGDKDDIVKHIEKCKNDFINLLASTD